MSTPAVRRIYQDLYIDYGSVTKWKNPGYIGLTSPGGGGTITPEHVQEAVKREVRKEDNQNKLNLADSNKERHLFVYVDGDNYLSWASLRDTDLSSLKPPQLPPEITHVWVASEFQEYGLAEEIVDYCRVWRAMRGEKWEKLM